MHNIKKMQIDLLHQNPDTDSVLSIKKQYMKKNIAQ